MKSFVLKFVVSVAFLTPVVFADDFEDAIAVVDSLDAANAPGMYDVNHFEYLDCWLEEAPEWGGILWKSNHKMGMREGVWLLYCPRKGRFRLASH